MVTERPPFSAESQMATLYKHASEVPTAPRLLNPKISREFEAVVLKALEKDPNERFQSYPELIDALLPPTEPMFPAARPAAPTQSWAWPASAAVGITLLLIILLAIFSAEVAPVPVEARVPAPPAVSEPLLIPPSPPPAKPAAPVVVEEPKPPPPSEEEIRKDFLRAASAALEEFRGSLPRGEEAELVAEIPWGTWRPDLFHAPGGEARYDGSLKSCVLTSRLESDRVWIKRPFAGARAGYQVRYRHSPGTQTARFALALTFTKWIELTPDAAVLYAVSADEKPTPIERVLLEPRAATGVVTVLPRPPHTLVFLEDRLLFSTPEADLASTEGMQLGSSGGTVFVESVRVKDRTR
jgi:hypothetical protein